MAPQPVMIGPSCGPVDLLAVDLVPTFPTARLLHIRAIDGGRQFTVLVPDDFSPLILNG